MVTNIEYLHADQIGGCVTLISTETTKICIDCGAHFTNTTVLLNLDTFEEKIFTIDK